MNSLAGRKALITGGGSGVGKAIAAALVVAGVDVVIASRRKPVPEPTVAAFIVVPEKLFYGGSDERVRVGGLEMKRRS